MYNRQRSFSVQFKCRATKWSCDEQQQNVHWPSCAFRCSTSHLHIVRFTSSTFPLLPLNLSLSLSVSFQLRPSDTFWLRRVRYREQNEGKVVQTLFGAFREWKQRILLYKKANEIEWESKRARKWEVKVEIDKNVAIFLVSISVSLRALDLIWNFPKS